jgi:hypothetical protein
MVTTFRLPLVYIVVPFAGPITGVVVKLTGTTVRNAWTGGAAA